MKNKQRFGRNALALAVVAALIGCGAGDVGKVIETSKARIARGDAKTAVVELKAALQDSPSSAEARVLLAQALFDTGDASSALIELRKALDLGYPKSSAAPLLGRVLLVLNDSKKLIAELSGLTLDDKEARASVNASLASAYLQTGDKPNFQKRLTATLSDRPDYPAGLFLRAQLLLSENDAAGAVKVLEGVVAREPTYTDARLLLGDIRQIVFKDYKGAISEFQEALKVKPDLVRAHVSLVNLYWSLGQRDDAKAQLAKLQQQQPNNFRTKFIEAQFAAVDKNFTRARDLSNVLLGVAPDYVELLKLAGTSESALGNQRQAASHLARALFIAPGRRDIRNTLGEIYLRSGQFERANEVVSGLVGPASTDVRALGIAAQAQLRLGRPGEARDLFLRASRIAPADVGLQASLAQLDFNAGDEERAVLRLQEIGANDKAGLAEQALVALQIKQKDYDGALKTVDRLATKDSDPSVPLMLRGQIASLRGDRATARKQYEQLLAKNPTNSTAVKALADFDIQDGKNAAAIGRYEAFLKDNPKDADATVELARLHSRTGAPKDQVVEELNRAIKFEPLDVRFRLLLIDYYANLNDQKGAVQAGQDGVAAMPNSEDLLLALGAAQLKAGEVQQALGSFRKIVQAKPRLVDGYLRMADAQLAANDKVAAEATLRQAMTVAPDSHRAQRQLAELLAKSSRADAAIAIAKSAQRLAPKDPFGYLLEADLQVQAGKRDAAASALRAGLKASASPGLAQALYRSLTTPTFNEKEAARAVDDWMKQNPRDAAFLRAVADMDMQAHRYPLAEQRYGRVIEIDPKDAPTLNNLAWLRLRLGKPGALALVERAVSLSPDNAAMLETQARALLNEKRSPEAVKVIRRALELRPDDVPLRLSGAEVLALAGEGASAEQVLAALAQLNSTSFVQTEVKRIRALIKS